MNTSSRNNSNIPWLTSLARMNVFAHLIGLAFAAIAMSPGTPLVSLSERMDYLAQSPAGWTIAWAVWMVCAFLLIAFLSVLVHHLGDAAMFARVGLIIAIVGAAFDLLCESICICIFPLVASWQNQQLFLIVERTTSVASLVIANGAYSVGILLISLDLREQLSNAFAVWTGFAVAAFGLVLAAAGFTGSTQHAMWATVPTMLSFCLWVLLVSRSLASSGRQM